MRTKQNKKQNREINLFPDWEGLKARPSRSAPA